MNKTALITGASSGIGLELAKIHASKGDNLVIVSRDKPKLDKLKIKLEENYKISVFVIEKDLSIPDSALEVYNKTKEENIQIDYLINNAGFGDYGLFYKANWEKESKMIALNITALTQFCKLYLKDMTERKSGKIMNVASTAAFLSGPLMAVYYATKSYVLHFSEAINNEISDKGITITTLCPGPTKSGFQSAASAENSSLFKNKKLPSSREVAEFGYDAMMKGKSVAIHGLPNKLLIILMRFLPRALTVKMVRKVQEET